ncbi:hypothetical protein [Geobacter sp. SVR]|uniref:hypothetical protein n=1 Tax=Geobacter sp. SVR TaxID=2495594 RepID=UPI00143F0239|nr:hypothetical protein [Geobacter sp. SVR]BCS52881.1 hypothetical protein GSVR_11890 [Geobacter sp. SVR]GCF87503.1 hypothetical protein GSbR_41030 [Geobacter sp. SVR]
MKSLHYAAALAGAALLSAGCTTYYQVREPAGGRAYYTTDIEETKAGSVKFTDEKSGSTITLQNSEIREIPKEEYEKGITSSAPGVPKK